MTFGPANLSKSHRRRRGWARLLIVIAGIVITQFILYGSSLIGRTLLLPLDMLADYSGSTSAPPVVPHDRLLHDPVNQIEPMRRFAVSEVRAGRWPLWDPNNYCGAPFLANNQSAVFSPFRLLDYLWPDPRVLAWGQMLKALVGGIGAYLFFRRAMRCRFIAAAIGAWIWPQSGFLVLWTMWPISAAALWLPWVLLAVRQTLGRARAKWIVLLAMFTCFALDSGHSATAAHLLLASGLYAIWLVFRDGRRFWAIVRVALGWLLGFSLAAPQLLPTMDYLRDSLRMENRLENGPEIKPVGLAALPQIVMPWIDGTTRAGWVYLNSDNPLESAIGGYVGLLTVLVLAPFGFIDRRKRKDQLFWIALCVIAAAYVLDLPGGEALQRLPVVSALPANRFIFVSGFALLAAGISGLDALLGSHLQRSRWFLIAPMIGLIFAGWCVWRVTILPEQVDRKAMEIMEHTPQARPVFALGVGRSIDQLGYRFQTLQFQYAAACVAAAVLCGLLYLRRSRALALAVGLLAVAEVLFSASPVNPQSDPSLYDWNLPAFNAIAAAEPGRICGVRCLPPMLNQWYNLSDIRGYDAADPKRYIEFLRLLADPKSPPPDAHAASFALIPRVPFGLTDFLGLRYMIYQGAPPRDSTPSIVTPEHYVIENRSALPRVTVPKRSIVIPDKAARLAALADPKFDPRETVIVESEPAIALKSDAIGDAHIVNELPCRVEIDYTMQTPGLIVLADEWDSGWHAAVNGMETPVLRANHAFRAVAVPAGNGRLVFTYNPASFRIGLWIAAIALTACIVLCLSELIHLRIIRTSHRS